MEDIKGWLADWFAENTGAGRDEILRHEKENYFKLGLIDSFQFISLIEDAEDEFHIEFENDQFEDRSFATVSGMAAVIEEAVKNGKI